VRIVLFTPVSAHSPIAAASNALVLEWRERGNRVDVVAVERNPVVSVGDLAGLVSFTPWRDVDATREICHDADGVVYQVADDPEAHAGIVDWVAEVPGIVLLHSFSLLGLRDSWLKENGDLDPFDGTDPPASAWLVGRASILATDDGPTAQRYRDELGVPVATVALGDSPQLAQTLATLIEGGVAGLGRWSIDRSIGAILAQWGVKSDSPGVSQIDEVLQFFDGGDGSDAPLATGSPSKLSR
jgi:hypothetical protein